MEDFLAHEDLGIYIILVLIVINSLIVMISEHRQTKKTDEMCSLLIKAINHNTTLIAENKTIAQDNSDTNAKAIEENKK